MATVSAYIFHENKKAGERFLNENNTEDIIIPVVTERDHVLGKTSAKITIFEYSETECPYCKVFHSRKNDLLEEFDGKIKLVYRHFPIATHPRSKEEAVATECSYEQGGHSSFWKYIDEIYRITPSNNNLEETDLYRTAEKQNLDTERFTECMKNRTPEDKVESDRVGGGIAGVYRTPSFIFHKDGQKKTLLSGGTYEQVREMILLLLIDER